MPARNSSRSFEWPILKPLTTRPREYFLLPRARRIHLLYLYAKGEQADMPPAQKKVARELVGLIKQGA